MAYLDAYIVAASLIAFLFLWLGLQLKDFMKREDDDLKECCDYLKEKIQLYHGLIEQLNEAFTGDMYQLLDNRNKRIGELELDNAILRRKAYNEK